jgi:bifunctional UDP-N-acetylglucosamine pyrophosphorylase/glucosamine-1-phosphate N-acetyltransferase
MDSRTSDKGQLLRPPQDNQSLNILILAAGLGTRMKSGRAKVLHELGGLPLIAYVCRAGESLDPTKTYVVVGHQAKEVERAVQTEIGDKAVFVTQTEQRGTGDAVMAARTELEGSDSLVLVLSGDVPLIREATLASFTEQHRASGAAC